MSFCGDHRVSIISYIHSTTICELPPPPPRACFGREELVEKIIGLATTRTPVALIGPGGIGKTSIALTVLHNDRIKQQFGDNRLFIRCDQFLASRQNFLIRLSTAVGASTKNPEDLAPLRPFLSSKILIVLDNAESILDPQGPGGKEIYGVVEELSQFDNIFLVITSRITTIPPDCEPIQVPTLTMDSARRAFRRIYNHHQQLELTDKILRQLDFHPLSVTLLATVARQNDWDINRLAREWEERQTGVLRTEHNNSLAVTVELSLTSPMFEGLGPDARELLGVIAFYPQGISEENVYWLFPSTLQKNILDKFHILSLTYRSNGYITMLAPLRDYLSPTDPKSSPLLCATKELYFTRLSVNVGPNRPGFEETRWIVTEDVNIEHLLDVFTSADATSDAVWDATAKFMQHLYWHKLRETVLAPKIEKLPDDHRFKPHCLSELSRFFQDTGDYEEQIRLLTHVLKLSRQRGDSHFVALTLRSLSGANLRLNLFEEGIQQAEEAVEIFERLGDIPRKGASLIILGHLLHEDNQLDAAEEVVFRALDLLQEDKRFQPLDLLPEDKRFQACGCHRLLGDIYRSKGDGEKAIHHYEEALQIASSSNWSEQIFWIDRSIALLSRDQEQVRSHQISQDEPSTR